MDKAKSIELLNRAIADELSAVHQYMYFHFRLEDLAYGPMAGLMKRIAIEEMGHIEELAERILFLGGEVEMEVAEETQKIHEAKEMLVRAREMEQKSADDYNKWARDCFENSDSESRKIFEQLVSAEERHFDLFDQQIDNIDRFGDQYLALQSMQSEEE